MYDASSAKKPTPFKSKVYKAMDKTVDTILAPIDKIENIPQDKLAKLYNNFIDELENLGVITPPIGNKRFIKIKTEEDLDDIFK